MNRTVEMRIDASEGHIEVKGLLISYEYNETANMYSRVRFTIGGRSQELTEIPANMIKINEGT